MLTRSSTPGGPARAGQRLNRYVIDNSTANRFVTFFHGEVDAHFLAAVLQRGPQSALWCRLRVDAASLPATGLIGDVDVRYKVEEVPLKE
jgi:hypothetical protein